MKCNHGSCNRNVQSKGFCSAHYKQFRKTGITKHLLTDPNEYEIKDNEVFITLYDNNRNTAYEKVVIDLIDYELIKGKRICYSYTKTSERIKVQLGHSKQKMLSRLLLNPADNMLVDHKDQNIFNNKRSNLRICTKSQNNMNRKCTKGVHFSKRIKRWVAYITVDWKRKHIGCFSTKKEAIEARLKAEKEIFKEFAPERL